MENINYDGVFLDKLIVLDKNAQRFHSWDFFTEFGFYSHLHTKGKFSRSERTRRCILGDIEGETFA